LNLKRIEDIADNKEVNMKVGDLVKITLEGEYHIDNPWISEGDNAIVLKVYEGEDGLTKGETLYKIAIVKGGHIVEDLLAKEIEKIEKIKNFE